MSRTATPPILRFMPKVSVRGENECWPWQGSKTPNGYGKFALPDRKVGAHRFAYEYFVGPIPDEYLVMHSCDNPPCVNPAHLLVGTNSDNMQDRYRKGRGRVHARPILDLEKEHLMVRPPIGVESMRLTVKFRLTDDELDDLKSLADGASLSEALRRLIHDEKKRRESA